MVSWEDIRKNLTFHRLRRFQLGDAGLSNNYGLLGYDIIAHSGYPVYENSDPKLTLIKTVQVNSLPFLINIRWNCVIL